MLANTLAGRGAITLNERIWAHFFSAVENERAPRTANENDRAQIACDGRGHVRLSEHRTPSQSCQRGRMFPLRDRWFRPASRLMPHPATGFP
jgi:hypothetical protein